MDLGKILFDFFGRRIAEQGQYGAIEYLVYGAIMLAVMFLIIYPLLNRKGMKFDFKFMLSLLPYILLGGTLRVLEDMALLPRSFSPLELGYWVITPGIYILIAAVTIASLFISKLLADKTGQKFHNVFAGIGLLFALPIALFEVANFVSWDGVAMVVGLVVAITAVTVFAFNKFTKSGLLKSNFNVLVLASQLLDGNATFVAIQFFKCGEQHPISEFLLKLLPFSFVLVKIALVLVILHYIDKEVEDKNLRGFLKIVVATLGFATGLRDLFTLGVGTCL